MLDTPVLFLVFNRPESTYRVFNAIGRVKPKQLFIAADGPRPHVPGEAELCNKVREIISNNISWDCDIQVKYNDTNQGCKVAVSSAINWFFEQVESGIILEDDCLPNDSFFTFCSELLQLYKYDEQVMMISGTSFQEKTYNNYSYYFSRYVHIWGWATWKDSWKKYDVELAGINDSKAANLLKNIFFTSRERKKWLNDFKSIKYENADTWDTQWMFTIWENKGLCIVPWKNLVSNIGYGHNATHTTMANSPEANLPVFSLNKIIHPKNIALHAKADRKIRFNKFIPKNTERIKRKFYRVLNLFNS